MASKLAVHVDFIEELRLRRWARENYVPVTERIPSWHPIVLEEMRRKDQEMHAVEPNAVLLASRA